MANKSGFIKYIEQYLSQVDVGNPTTPLVIEKLKSMSASELDALVTQIEREEFYLPLYKPNNDGRIIKINVLLKLGEELKAPIFTQVVKEDSKTGQLYISPTKYWVALWPDRRQLQYRESKMSIAKHNKSRDLLTGQVASDSKGSSFSNPQLTSALSRGCTNSALELMKGRGGDLESSRILNQQLINSGSATLASIFNSKSKPQSTLSVASYLDGMHLQNTMRT